MFSFPRAGRLKQKNDFQSLFSQSRKISYQYLLVLYRANHLDYARIGIVLPKRLVKKAVRRNLLRRIIKESFRYHQAYMKGFDVVVLLRSAYNALSLAQLTKTALRQDIDTLWQKLISSCTTSNKR